MGLDQPLYVQFTRYAGEILSGNLGESWKTGQPVLTAVGDRLPATLELAATAFLMALAIGLLLGVLAAVYAGTWVRSGSAPVRHAGGGPGAVLAGARCACMSSTTRCAGPRRRWIA